MKKAVTAVAALLTLALSVSAFAIEGSQQTETGITFEQIKANHLKKLDDRIVSLQQEKTCVQAAKDQADMMACRSKHRDEMKERRDDMRKGKGRGGPGSQVPPPVN